MSAEDILNRSSTRLMDSRTDLNHLLGALARTQGIAYMDAYREYAKASADAGTVHRALENLGADTHAIRRELDVAQRADDALRKLHARAQELTPARSQEPVADAGALTAPEAIVSRFAEAGRLTNRYAGPEGLQQFKLENEQAALMGRDLLDDYRVPMAQAHARRLLQQQERGIVRAANADLIPSERLHLLDSLTSAGLKTLQQELGGKRTLDVAPESTTGPSDRARQIDRRVKDELMALGRGMQDYQRTLDAMIADGRIQLA